MSIGRSREEQELTAALAKTLVVREVLEPMDKIGWGHGSPPPPQPAGQPDGPREGTPGQAPAPATTTTPGQPEVKPEVKPEAAAPKTGTPPDPPDLRAYMESLRDANGLILGKYKDPDAAIKGVAHAVTMAKQAFVERDTLQAQLVEVQRAGEVQPRTPATVAQTTQPKSFQPPSRANVDAAKAAVAAVLTSIVKDNEGILDAESAEKLSAAQEKLAEAAADYRVQEDRASQKAQQDAENAEWAATNEFMAKNHPEAERFADDVSVFLQSEPLINSAVSALLAQGKRTDATVLAWTSFQKTHGDQMAADDLAKAEDKEAELAAKEQARQEHLANARKDAGVVTGSAGGAGAHENPNAAGPSREQINAVRDRMAREGDAPGSPAAMAFRRMVIPLDPSIFGPQQ